MVGKKNNKDKKASRKISDNSKKKKFKIKYQ